MVCCRFIEPKAGSLQMTCIIFSCAFEKWMVWSWVLMTCSLLTFLLISKTDLIFKRHLKWGRALSFMNRFLILDFRQRVDGLFWLQSTSEENTSLFNKSFPRLSLQFQQQQHFGPPLYFIVTSKHYCTASLC